MDSSSDSLFVALGATIDGIDSTWRELEAMLHDDNRDC